MNKLEKLKAQRKALDAEIERLKSKKETIHTPIPDSIVFERDMFHDGQLGLVVKGHTFYANKKLYEVMTTLVEDQLTGSQMRVDEVKYEDLKVGDIFVPSSGSIKITNFSEVNLFRIKTLEKDLRVNTQAETEMLSIDDSRYHYYKVSIK
jgi:hypothetical protein